MIEDIILSYNGIWGILFALFLGLQFQQIREQIKQMIESYKNDSLITLEDITKRIESNSDFNTESKINITLKKVKAFINKQDYTSDISDLILFLRNSTLFISSYYFSLMLSALYIKSNFAYSYIGFYGLVCILLLFLVLCFFIIFRKIDNVLTFISFPCLITVFLLMGFIDIVRLEDTEKIIKNAPFTYIVPIVATLLPFLLYVIFRIKNSMLLKKQEKIINDNQDFKKLKSLNNKMIKQEQHKILLNDANNKVNMALDDINKNTT